MYSLYYQYYIYCRAKSLNPCAAWPVEHVKNLQPTSTMLQPTPTMLQPTPTRLKPTPTMLRKKLC